jgi:hypothetical protein
MNKEIKEKWINALRSGKYEQGKSQLRSLSNKFCCLGVLCDLYKDELKDENKTFSKFKKDSEYEKYIKGLDELLYKKGLPHIVEFTTEPDPTEQSNKEKNLLSLYKGDANQINNFETFDGKIKFN